MATYRPKGAREYWYDFKHGGARFRARTGATEKREADRIEKWVKAQVRVQAPIGTGRPEMTLNVAASRYYREVASTQPSAKWSDYLLESVVKGVGKDVRLSELSENGLTDFVARLRARVSNATANRHIEILRRLMRRANKVWKVQTADIDWASLRHDEPDERVRELTPQEERALFANLRQDYHPFVRFCLVTGVRKNNALSLTWRQVDFDAGVITLKVKSRKPGGRVHTVPITSELTALLARERGRHDSAVFTYRAVKTRDGRVRGGRYPITGNGLRRAWGHALRAADIVDFRFHDLRHTAATRLLRESGNLRLAQRLLGHKDISTTAKYAHVDDADLRHAMERASSAAATRETQNGKSQYANTRP